MGPLVATGPAKNRPKLNADSDPGVSPGPGKPAPAHSSTGLRGRGCAPTARASGRPSIGRVAPPAAQGLDQAGRRHRVEAVHGQDLVGQEAIAGPALVVEAGRVAVGEGLGPGPAGGWGWSRRSRGGRSGPGRGRARLRRVAGLGREPLVEHQRLVAPLGVEGGQRLSQPSPPIATRAIARRWRRSCWPPLSKWPTTARDSSTASDRTVSRSQQALRRARRPAPAASAENSPPPAGRHAAGAASRPDGRRCGLAGGRGLRGSPPDRRARRPGLRSCSVGRASSRALKAGSACRSTRALPRASA
jgi:hypothetical protein